MKKKITLVLLLLVLATSLFATDQYIDTPDGRRLVLHEDGTYEYLEVEPQSLVGAVYTPDFYKLIDLVVSPDSPFYDEDSAMAYKFLELILQDEELIKAAVAEALCEEEEFAKIVNSEIIFGNNALLFSLGDETYPSRYKLSNRFLMLEDEGEYEYLGTFNEDFSTLTVLGILPYQRVN